MVKGYSATQIMLHWVIAVLIIFQVIFGEAMAEAWDDLRDAAATQISTMAWAHILVGIAVLAFGVWRIVLRLTRGAPPAPPATATATLAAAAVHLALYALMIGAPITGLLAWYGGFEDLAEVHEMAKPALVILIAVHVLAALYHQFFLKDGLLNRMRKPLD